MIRYPEQLVLIEGFLGVPPAERERKVYFLQNLRTRFIKIGVSNNPKSRMKDLQTGSADPHEFLAIFPGDERDEARLGNYIHESLSP